MPHRRGRAQALNAGSRRLGRRIYSLLHAGSLRHMAVIGTALVPGGAGDQHGLVVRADAGVHGSLLFWEKVTR